MLAVSSPKNTSIHPAQDVPMSKARLGPSDGFLVIEIESAFFDAFISLEQASKPSYMVADVQPFNWTLPVRMPVLGHEMRHSTMW